jgi:hypothetical protein
MIGAKEKHTQENSHILYSVNQIVMDSTDLPILEGEQNRCNHSNQYAKAAIGQSWL